MIEEGEERGVSFRATVIIDRDSIVRHMAINDLAVNVNVDEILRMVKAFQFFDEKGINFVNKENYDGSLVAEGTSTYSTLRSYQSPQLRE